jgi:hypothetical protein
VVAAAADHYALATTAANPDVAGTPFNVTVTAQDPYGNTATGYHGTAHFASNDTAATLPADYAFPAADNGVHTFSGVVLRTARYPLVTSITATDTVTGSITGSAGVRVVAAPATHFLLSTAAANPDIAGTRFDVTVTAQDPYGNTDTGYLGTVHFGSADPYGASLPADFSFRNVDQGFHRFPAGATLYTAGTWDVTATDTQSNITGSANVNVIAAPASQFGVATDAANPDVAGTVFDVTLTAQDPYGNTATGYTGTVHFTSADPYGASLPADYTFQASDQGVHTFAGGAALYTAGTWDVTASETSSGITGTANVNVMAAPASQFVVSTDAANPDIAGTAFDVTVVATDPYGNTDTNYTGTVHFSSADPYGASLPADYTFQPSDQGVASFSGMTALYTAGTWDVTATDTGSGISGAAFVNVQAAPAVALQVVAPASAASGAAFDMTVIAVDSYGNTDTNFQGTVTFSTSDPDPGVLLPPDYAFQVSDAGMVTFPGGVTLITPGDQTLTATDTVSGITGAATVTVTSGAAPGVGGFGANPAISERPPSATVPTGTARPSTAAADPESLPVRAPSVGATAHRAVLIDHVWSDPAGLLLTGPWTDGLGLTERR